MGEGNIQKQLCEKAPLKVQRLTLSHALLMENKDDIIYSIKQGASFTYVQKEHQISFLNSSI